MNFFKRKWGLIAVLISLCVILGVLWACLFGFQRKKESDGTLVWLVLGQVEAGVPLQGLRHRSFAWLAPGQVEVTVWREAA